MKDKLAFYMHENKKYDKIKKSLKKKCQPLLKMSQNERIFRH